MYIEINNITMSAFSQSVGMKCNLLNWNMENVYLCEKKWDVKVGLYIFLSSVRYLLLYIEMF